MPITQTLIANVEAQAGYTYKWIVDSTTNCDGFYVGQELDSGTLISNPQTLELEVTYPDICTSLIIKLVIYDNNNECDLFLFDVINQVIDQLTHWECIAQDDIGYACTLMPGPIELPTHYSSQSACQACSDCFCNMGPPPPPSCFDYFFDAVYTCPTLPFGQGTLVITLTISPTPFIPVVLTSVSLGLINGGPIVVIPNLNLEFNSPMDSVAIPVTLPAGTYNVIPYLQTGFDCEITGIPVEVNCPGPPPENDGDLTCCSVGQFFGIGGGSIGNVGNVNTFILYYGDNIDPATQDLIIDFGTNTVADKLEVYDGVVAKQDIIDDIGGLPLVGATSYVGTTGHCLNGYGYPPNNVNNCFVPAVGLRTEMRNYVLQGGKEFTGIYDSGGTVVSKASKATFTGPNYAAELMGNNLTHNTITGQPVPGQGGGINGTCRLIIPAGSYGSPDSKVTLAVHNNGTVPSETNSSDACCYGYSNLTAWKLWVHCPECPECTADFTIEDTCTTGVGGISVEITDEFNGPVSVILDPNTFSSLEYAVTTPVYLHLASNNTYYQLTYNPIAFNLYSIILPTLIVGEVITFLYDSNYDPIDMANDIWSVYFLDVDGCNMEHTTTVECDCRMAIVPSGTTTICTPDPVNLTVEITGTECAINLTTTSWEIVPAAPWITVSAVANELIITNNDTPIAGTYEIFINHECVIGNCNIDNSLGPIVLTVNEYDCSIFPTITGTTCGNTNGKISLVVTCPGGTIEWAHDGSSLTTISNLPAGTYSLIICNADGCCDQEDYVVKNVTTLAVTVPNYEIECKEINLSAVEVTVSGGTAPYNLTLYRLIAGLYTSVFNDPAYVSLTAILDAGVTGGLIAGTYKVKVEDAAGCIQEVVFTITAIPVPPINFLVQNTTCEQANGLIMALTAGLTADHTMYMFNYGSADCGDNDQPDAIPIDFTVGENITITGLYAGTYSLCVFNTVTDCCDCKDVVIGNYGLSPNPPDENTINVCAGTSVNLLNFVTGCDSGTIPVIYPLGSNIPLGYTTIVFNNNATYEVACEAVGCSSERVPLVITVYPNPVVVINGSSIFCKSSLINLATVTATCNGTGVWSFPNASGVLQTYTATCNGVTCPLPAAAISALSTLINASPNIVSVGLTFTCTASNGCVGIANKTLHFHPSPTVQTNNLTVCPSFSFANAAAFSGALGYTPPGYSCGTPVIYSNSNCNSVLTYPYVGPTSGNSVTLYLKTSCFADGPTCASSCVPFTVTAQANQVVPITQVTTCAGGSYTTTYTAASMNGVYNWIASPGGTFNNHGNQLVLVGSPSTSRTVTLAFIPNPGSGLCPGGALVTTTYPALPTITGPTPASTHCATDPQSTYTYLFNAATSTVTYNVTGNTSSVAVVNGFGTPGGTLTITNTSVIGTATVTITATNSLGCVTTRVVVITVENCIPPDPCANCTYGFNSISTEQSSLTFTNPQICGTTLDKYIFLVRDNLDTPIAYIANTLLNENGAPMTLDHPLINYVLTYGVLSWNLPLLAENGYKLSLIWTNSNLGACSACEENVPLPTCFYEFDISCVTCGTSFIKEYNADISGIVDSTTYELCLPCDGCYRFMLETFGENPDGLYISENSDFSSPVELLPVSYTSVGVQTIKFGTATSLPYRFDYGLSPCIDGFKKFYIQVKSGALAVDAFAKWKLTGSCCSCLLNCPPFTSPCVDVVTANMDGTTTFNLKATGAATAGSTMINQLIGQNKCNSSCSNISSAHHVLNANSDYFLSGNQTYSIVNGSLIPTLGQCSTPSCTSYLVPYTPCPSNSRALLAGTATYTKLSASSYSISFTDVLDYNKFKTMFQFAETPACTLNAKKFSSVQLGFIKYASLPGCGDLGTSQDFTILIKECENEICNDLSTITYNDGLKTITVVRNHALGPYSSAIVTCPYPVNALPDDTVTTNAISTTSNQSFWYLMSTTNYAFLNYGAAIEECYSFNRYKLMLTDTGDSNTWCLGSELATACEASGSINSINQMGNVKYLLQFGSTFLNAADAIAELSAAGFGTYTEHPDGATQGAGTCTFYTP